MTRPFGVKATPTQCDLLRRLRRRLGDRREHVVPGKLAQPWFNDAWKYWYAASPDAGVKIPAKLGVRIKVKSMTPDLMTIWVDNVK